VVIDFWATWCPPCVASLPGWQALSGEGLAADLVSANTEGDAVSDVKKFLDEKKYTFAVHLADPGLQARLQVETLPTTLVIGKDGVIAAYWVGIGPESRVRDAIARLR
jgi:thiol-disulfide isomerase/thioredoxin